MIKNTKLKLLSLLTAVCLCLTFFTTGAGAAESEKKYGAAAITELADAQLGQTGSKYQNFFKYYGPWCCCFVSWCARKANIPEDIIPTYFSCTDMKEYFVKKGLYKSSSVFGGNYEPKIGDLVFFSNSHNPNDLSHIGIVKAANDSYVTCIEGNCHNIVKEIDRQYSGYMVGFATPQYCDVSVSPDTDTPPDPLPPKYETGTYILNEDMRLRSEPSLKANIIEIVPKGTEVNVSEVSDMWGKINYNKKIGWISLDYSTPKENSETTPTPDPVPSPAPTPDDNTKDEESYIVKESTNLRDLPTTENSVVYITVPAGTKIKVKEKKDNWGKIIYKDIEGWICLDWSSPYVPPKHDTDWLMIDISQHQSSDDLDWEKIKEAGVKAVIIRIGGRYASMYGNAAIYTDDEFMKHYTNAKNAGLHVGVYFYSYALSASGAQEEAQFVINTLRLNNCELDMPVFIDMEDYYDLHAHEKAGKQICTEVLDTFCETIETAGYYAGIYTSSSFIESFVDEKVFNGRAAWVADWNSSPEENGWPDYYGRIDMWQYTEEGKIDGITPSVDFSRCYVNFPSLITNIESNNLVKGDLDNDGFITATDARIVLRYSVRMEEFNRQQKFCADMDNDGLITASDSRIILKESVN